MTGAGIKWNLQREIKEKVWRIETIRILERGKGNKSISTQNIVY